MPAEPERADHRPYIETVRRALAAADFHVGDAAFDVGRLRSAAMALIAPDDDSDDPWAHTFARAERVELRWNEEGGWSLLAVHTGGDRSLPTVWRRGFAVVLPPGEVCTWLGLLLTMPALSSSQEDGPYRAHKTHDPAFEAALASYAR